MHYSTLRTRKRSITLILIIMSTRVIIGIASRICMWGSPAPDAQENAKQSINDFLVSRGGEAGQVALAGDKQMNLTASD